jgi:hypothetical protein
LCGTATIGVLVAFAVAANTIPAAIGTGATTAATTRKAFLMTNSPTRLVTPGRYCQAIEPVNPGFFTQALDMRINCVKS